MSGTGLALPPAGGVSDATVAFAAELIDRSGKAPVIEAALAHATGRPRPLPVRAVLTPLLCLAIDDRPLFLTEATGLLFGELSGASRALLGVPGTISGDRAFLAAYRRVRYCFHRICDVVDLTVASYVGARQGLRFVAFYACMFYGLMRPAETARLTKAGCYLPGKGWGSLTFGDSVPAPGKEWTNSGNVHEERGLKGRSRKSVRKVPIPPQLVRLLREHIERFGTTLDGRLFRSENGGPIHPSTWWQVWRKVRNLALTPEQLATPLMKRPYDLRHAGITWRLNSGVPAPDVAKWAGHSVEVLTRVYAGCVAGLDEVWIARMNAGLCPGGAPEPQERERSSSDKPRGEDTAAN